jgi:hypothetical protein
MLIPPAAGLRFCVGSRLAIGCDLLFLRWVHVYFLQAAKTTFNLAILRLSLNDIRLPCAKHRQIQSFLSNETTGILLLLTVVKFTDHDGARLTRI